MARILIIDDDQQVLKLFVSFLTREGHEVVTAEDGKRGIKLLTDQQFDLVITDIIMPEQDGLEVLMWLRKQPDRPKIIAVTGGSVSIDQELLLKTAGFTADIAIPKPVNYSTLTGAVRELLPEQEK